MDPVMELMVLGRVPGMGPARIRSLVTSLGGIDAARRATRASLASVRGIGTHLADTIHGFYHGEEAGRVEPDVADGLRRLRASGATAVHLWDPEYPPLLARTFDPPPVLFIRGTLLSSDQNAVAVVGTRRPSPHGLEVAGYFGRELAAAGLTVVSGLARGIDTRAHAEALAAGGRSFAIVGTGLDQCYPPENARLADAVASQGAVLSEFEPGTAAEPGNFPRRNRVISGISLGTVVVESDLNGGAMITAHLALDANREVFAVPGTSGSPTSRGCHALIREGKAKLTEHVDDVLVELLSQFTSGFKPGGRAGGIPPTLNQREEHLYSLLGPEPVHVDTLSSTSGLPVQYLIVDLLGLEMKGLVRQLPGKYFLRAL